MNITTTEIVCLFVGTLLFGFTAPICRKYGRKNTARETCAVPLGALLGFAAAYVNKSDIASSLTVIVFFYLITAVAFIDYDTCEIPDIFHPLVALCGIISVFTMPGMEWWQRLCGMLCISLPMFLLCLFIEGAFGGGDIKLMFCAGLLLGLRLSVLTAFIAIIAGGLYGVVLLLGKKTERKGHFAFGPFLCTGMMVSLLVGNQIVDWYLRLCSF